MAENKPSNHVAVVGGGLVGALEACMMARRGFKVTLFESRHDGRNEPTYYGRSINLAISLRGISALGRLDLTEVVDQQAIPMGARMIHDRTGKTHAIPYDRLGRCINSIERAALNNYLLNKAEQEFGVEILFNHKLIDMKIEQGELLFLVAANHRGPRSQADQESQADQHRNSSSAGVEDQLKRYHFGLILGCDGARSSVRSLLSRQTKVDVSQRFIEHNYMELRIDPNEADNSFRMPHNYLHIWPRGQYMMIALPNKDASFTCTLFAPDQLLASLVANPQRGLEFFEAQFKDAVQLIGAERIVKTLAHVRPSPLISIETSTYNFKGRVALLGDAAHAMVPFYGQGMNCGFEDCLVLDELLDKHSIMPLGAERPNNSYHHQGEANLFHARMEQALDEYSRIRCPNGRAMCQLAMYNYVEMRDLVNTWRFAIRKRLDNLLYRFIGSRWMPLYTMVTFSRLPIDQCLAERTRQDSLLDRTFEATIVLLASFACGGLWVLWNSTR